MAAKLTAREEVFMASRNFLVRGLLQLKETTYEHQLGRRLRMSALPFCSLLLAPQFDSDTTKLEEYRSHFYFKTGHALHDLLQTFLPRGALLKNFAWGNWKCSVCKAKTTKPCLIGDAVPCRCKSTARDHEGLQRQLLYVELDVKYRDTLTGHIDMLLRFKGKDGEYYFVLVDFKTALFKNDYQEKYPVPSNVFQVSGYCAVLEETLGMKIAGWHLAYVDRSKPIQSAQDFHVVSSQWREGRSTPFWLRRLDGYVTQFKIARKLQQSDFQDKGRLLKLVTRRPCQSEEDYKREMSAAFYYDGPCPHKEICCGGTSNRAILRHFSDAFDQAQQYRSSGGLDGEDAS